MVETFTQLDRPRQKRFFQVWKYCISLSEICDQNLGEQLLIAQVTCGNGLSANVARACLFMIVIHRLIVQRTLSHTKWYVSQITLTRSHTLSTMPLRIRLRVIWLLRLVRIWNTWPLLLYSRSLLIQVCAEVCKVCGIRLYTDILASKTIHTL